MVNFIAHLSKYQCDEMKLIDFGIIGILQVLVYNPFGHLWCSPNLLIDGNHDAHNSRKHHQTFLPFRSK